MSEHVRLGPLRGVDRKGKAVRSTIVLGALLALVLASATIAAADAPRTDTYAPSFIPPAELVEMLGAHEAGGRTMLVWTAGGAEHAVEARCNPGANLLFLTGDPDDLAEVAALIRSFDVAPSQISIEARVVEIDTDRASDLGIDWSQISLRAGLDQSVQRRATTSFRSIVGTGNAIRQNDRTTSDNRTESASLTLNNALHLLQENGAATYRDAPHVLTLNNQAASVFDGTRVTYVNRAASYANIYQTEVMDAGLKLDVTPSLLQSGHLRLRLHTELTTLLNPTAVLSAGVVGSPVKEGQQVDDVIMARDGETVLLGGFTRTVRRVVHQRFPGLGNVLPFLFSRDIEEERHHVILIAITPRVVALGTGVDERTRRMLEVR